MSAQPSQNLAEGHDVSAAILPDGKEIPCTLTSKGFHGTCLFDPEQVFKDGIPAKGTDRRLLEHVLGNASSAFRGMTVQAVISPYGQGAAHWAIGGWIYELESVPCWDVEKELQGRVPRFGGYGDCPTRAELERAFPARLSRQFVVRAAEVGEGRVVDGNVMPLVGRWKTNLR